ncbi:hypothetical protein QOZ43_29225, partial [Pseudomonas aeruginosa]|uniref:hypothetical protein n=1 Tax=Pseudomonas aeruginosa TaxID=287 RepID=UPI00345B02E8
MLYEYYLNYVSFHLKNGFVTSPMPLGKFNVDEFTSVRGLMQILPTNQNTPFTDTDTSQERKVYNYGIKVSNLNLTD